jgi:Tol biopolymer transport system component
MVMAEFEGYELHAPSATGDDLGLFFTQLSSGDIVYAFRANAAAAFSPPSTFRLANVNSTSAEFGPSVTRDGLVIAFTSDRLGNDDLFVSSRPSVDSDFAVPVALSNVNSDNVEAWPAISSDGLVVFYEGTGSGFADIYQTQRPSRSDSFGTPSRVVELSTTYSEGDPAFSADGSELYFASNRPGGDGGSDLWVATRSCLSP